MRPKTEH